MAVHHIVKDSRDICAYCKSDLKYAEWHSHFHHGFHYKSTHCKCGKNLHIKVNFDGSGHDEWSGKKSNQKIKTLENKIKLHR